jgi:nucleoside-diphosphate-sugar epimerase
MKKNFWKNKTVLVTGANGFLGSAFLAAFQNNNIRALGLDLRADFKRSVSKINMLEEKKLVAFCKQEKINLIIHCASLDGNAYFKQNNSARILSENVQLATNILKVAKEQGIKELVIFSSSEIYNNSNKPLQEADDYTKYPILINNSYAISKILIEIMAEAYIREFGLKILVPRPANIYGPGDKIATDSDRVIPSMINKILSGQSIEIWGDGKQIRNFAYIDDVVKIILSLVESRKFVTVNIANQELITIKDLASLIIKLTGKKNIIKFTNSKLGGALKRTLDTSKSRSLLKFKETELADGLVKTIKHYQTKQL